MTIGGKLRAATCRGSRRGSTSKQQPHEGAPNAGTDNAHQGADQEQFHIHASSSSQFCCRGEARDVKNRVILHSPSRDAPKRRSARRHLLSLVRRIHSPVRRCSRRLDQWARHFRPLHGGSIPRTCGPRSLRTHGRVRDAGDPLDPSGHRALRARPRSTPSQVLARAHYDPLAGSALLAASGSVRARLPTGARTIAPPDALALGASRSNDASARSPRSSIGGYRRFSRRDLIKRRPGSGCALLGSRGDVPRLT